MSGRAAHDVHTGSLGNARLESQSDECDDRTTLTFNRNIGDLCLLFSPTYYEFIRKSRPEIQLKCHEKPSPSCL
jgi:hypothetical protein